jgi:hypothetical protein
MSFQDVRIEENYAILESEDERYLIERNEAGDSYEVISSLTVPDYDTSFTEPENIKFRKTLDDSAEILKSVVRKSSLIDDISVEEISDKLDGSSETNPNQSGLISVSDLSSYSRGGFQ